MQASLIVRLTYSSWRSHGDEWHLAVLWNNIFSDSNIPKPYPLDYRLICVSAALEHLGLLFLLKTTVLCRCCKVSPVGGGGWLHSILCIVYYKGFAHAEIWHSCFQSETSSFHLLLHPEVLEMPSLCFTKNLCRNTNMTSVMSGSLDGSTSKMITGAQESLGTVILWQQTIGSLQVFHEVDSDFWEGVSG